MTTRGAEAPTSDRQPLDGAGGNPHSRLTARRAFASLSPWAKPDRLVVALAGSGPISSKPFRLPRGIYTVFTNYDPPDPIRMFRLVDAAERSFPVWSTSGQVGQVAAPVVQQELKGGCYHIEIDSLSRTGSWQAQVVLNAPLSWRRPPHVKRRPRRAPARIEVRSGGMPRFDIPRTGLYAPLWRFSGLAAERLPVVPYRLELRAADGHTVFLGEAEAGRDHRVTPAFLGAGSWTVEMTAADADWKLMLSPVTGRLGGGARAF